jgi:UDP-N-acetyl-D-galactosamine dehydrogenase
MSKNRQIAVVGLGYVGMPIAVYFGRVQRVIAFDINAQRIDELKRNIDRNHDVASEEIAKSTVDWTMDPSRIKDADGQRQSPGFDAFEEGFHHGGTQPEEGRHRGL